MFVPMPYPMMNQMGQALPMGMMTMPPMRPQVKKEEPTEAAATAQENDSDSDLETVAVRPARKRYAVPAAMREQPPTKKARTESTGVMEATPGEVPTDHPEVMTEQPETAPRAKVALNGVSIAPSEVEADVNVTQWPDEMSLELRSSNDWRLRTDRRFCKHDRRNRQTWPWAKMVEQRKDYFSVSVALPSAAGLDMAFVRYTREEEYCRRIMALSPSDVKARSPEGVVDKVLLFRTEGRISTDGVPAECGSKKSATHVGEQMP